MGHVAHMNEACRTGGANARAASRGQLIRCLNTRQLHGVVSRQQTALQAQDELLEKMIGA